jgi:hypothetical protein
LQQFYKAIQALDIIKKFKEYYSPSHDMVVDEAMTGFRERFHLKQHVPRNPPKWGIKAWGLTDSSNCYLLSCQIYQKEETRNKDLLLGGELLLQMTEEYVGQ